MIRGFAEIHANNVWMIAMTRAIQSKLVLDPNASASPRMLKWVGTVVGILGYLANIAMTVQATSMIPRIRRVLVTAPVG